eukprot:TRINITY_DN2290_c0_g2_i2.p1 TRINITY_DN2290_c0_g2~~TRINITY_DN2290_c0_g2_i2.p1  ORF type:complete len:403 (+),score=54.37 TRINITY_DN2290_c0_g2_i2:74-1210(+)
MESIQVWSRIKETSSRMQETLNIWKLKINFKSIFKQTWYIIGLSFVIIFAYLLRPYGNDKVIENSTLSESLVILIFFNNGLILSIHELGNSIRNWRMILLSQLFIFIITPVLMYSLVWMLVLSNTITTVLATGLMVVGCLPTTISTCVVYTDMAKGNTAGALLNACVSNSLCVVVSPFLLSILKFSTKTKYPSILEDINQAKNVFFNLLVSILIPLIAGLIVRFILSRFASFRNVWLEKYKKIATPLSSIFMLINIFLVFCSTFAKNSARDASGLRDFFVLLCFLPLMHAVYILTSFFVSGIKKLGFSHADRVAVVFVSSQKAISIAIPLITRIYGYDKDSATIVLPILVYLFIFISFYFIFFTLTVGLEMNAKKQNF